MQLRKFYFYHHYSAEVQKKDEHTTYVWLPLCPESEQMILHIKGKTPGCEIKIQGALSEKFKSSAISDQSANEINNNDGPKKIFLYAQSDTLANSISIIGKNLTHHKLTYLVPKNSTEKADTFFTTMGIQFTSYTFGLLKKEYPDIFILLNDWSKEAKRIIAHCRYLHIPVVCLQESVIDFGDQFKRMQYADEVFVQGSQTVIDLPRQSYYVTGNPRYENIPFKKNEGEYVLINCNFTYGIFEDKREGWLDDIHHALINQDLEYVISQHPRDSGNLVKYKKVISSSSSSVPEQLNKSNLLITRFSSLIHEALVMGVPVIYYNPHGEKMKYDFEFDGKILQLATSRKELEKCLVNFKNLILNPTYLNEYLARHCICKSSTPSNNIKYLVSSIEFKPESFSWKDFMRMVFYHPTIKRVLSKIRKVFRK